MSSRSQPGRCMRAPSSFRSVTPGFSHPCLLALPLPALRPPPDHPTYLPVVSERAPRRDRLYVRVGARVAGSAMCRGGTYTEIGHTTKLLEATRSKAHSVRSYDRYDAADQKTFTRKLPDARPRERGAATGATTVDTGKVYVLPPALLWDVCLLSFFLHTAVCCVPL